MARKKSKTLTELELDIMQIVWQTDEIAVEELRQALKKSGRTLALPSIRTMLGICAHGNVASVLLVANGCEVVQPELLTEELDKMGQPYDVVSVQEDGGTPGCIEKGTKIAAKMVEEVRRQFREIKGLMAHACYAGNSSKRTELAGQKKPNAWGFYDMQGNVAEWCNDIYAADYYGQATQEDPRGPTEGKKRVLRGGSWKTQADGCRVTARWADEPGIDDACFAKDSYGFRMVKQLNSEDESSRADSVLPSTQP